MNYNFMVVFDTNILCVPFDKRADFTKFHFNGTFRNIIDKIEELDIYQNVNVAIPEIVWGEMREQKICAYNDKIEKMTQNINKFKFPFHTWSRVENEEGYPKYLDQMIERYKEELRDRQVNIEKLPLPSENRFKSIVERALNKRPPFEGKGGLADKGFKDALIWESLLEYKSHNNDVQLLLYTKDNMFNEDLEKEYAHLFNGDNIKIFHDNETSILTFLEEIAKKIDSSVYIPKEEDDDSDVKEWIYSEDFIKAICEHESQFTLANKYIHIKSVSITDIYDIGRKMDDNDVFEEISVSMIAKVIFDVKGVAQIDEEYDMTIDLNMLAPDNCWISDLYINEAGEDNE